MATLDTLLTNMDASCIFDLATYQRAGLLLGASVPPMHTACLCQDVHSTQQHPHGTAQHLLVSPQEGQEQLEYNQEQVVAIKNQLEKVLKEKLEAQKDDAAAYNALATE